MDKDVQALLAIGGAIALGGVILAVIRAGNGVTSARVEAREPRGNSIYGLRAQSVTAEQEFSFTPEVIRELELRVASGDGDLEIVFTRGDSPVVLRAGANPLILTPEKNVEQFFVRPTGSSTKFDASVEVFRRG